MLIDIIKTTLQLYNLQDNRKWLTKRPAISLIPPNSVFASWIPLNLAAPLQAITPNPPAIHYSVPLIPRYRDRVSPNPPRICFGGCSHVSAPVGPARLLQPPPGFFLSLIVCVKSDPSRCWDNVRRGDNDTTMTDGGKQTESTTWKHRG